MADIDKDLFRQAVDSPSPVQVADQAPAVQETPKPDDGAAAAPTPPTPAAPSPPEGAEAAIPSWRLREEAEARRAAEERARTLEERLNQVITHVQQAEAAKKAPDFFEDPNKATQALIVETLKPFAEELMRREENTRQALMYMGRMAASSAYGAETVDEAEQAFLKARDAKTLDTNDYEAVVQSPNRYDAVVKWHRRQSTLEAVGDDPRAWFEKELETRMADPEFQAKFLERVRTDASARPAQTNLPPSLSRVPAAAPNREKLDASDQGLFRFA